MIVDVSFIIPFHQKTPLLDKVIESIRGQDCEANRELILVDDSRSSDLISFPGCKVIRTWGQGPSIARNAGASIASGRYLAFIDSDVVLSENWLKECLREIEKFPGIAAVQAPLSIGLLNTETPSFLDKYRQSLKRWSTQGTDLYMYEGSIMLNTAGLLCRRNYFQSIGGFEPKLRRNEDLYFTYRLLMDGYSLSTTLSTGGQVYHDKGILSYVGKYIRQAQADKSLEKALGRKGHPELRKFSTQVRGFRFFRYICLLFYRLGLFLPIISIPSLKPVPKMANALIGLTPDARLIFNGIGLCLLNIRTLDMAVFPLNNFSWKFPLTFEPTMHQELKRAGLIHEAVLT
jgi:glycosyltransferase involved in cell wall biosynthesis